MINSIVENRQELEERTHGFILPEIVLLDFEMLVQLRDYVKVCFLAPFICVCPKSPLFQFFCQFGTQ